MRKLKEKDGFSYILVCILTLFTAMLIFAGLQYASVLNVMKMQKKQVQLQLDTAVTEEAIEYYDAIKQGSRYNRYIEESNLEDAALRKMGFGNYATEEIRTELDGRVISVMERPSVSATVSDGFGVHVEYVLTVPFDLFGEHIADIRTYVEMDSYYKLK